MSLLTGSANFIRYLLFGFNLLFVITGIILISVGASVSAIYEGYRNFLIIKFFEIPTFLIVIGSFIFIISFFGCYGAFKENYCLIFTFSILMIIIFIFELSAGIAGYVLRDDASNLIRGRLNETMNSYKSNSNEEVVKLWDELQTKFVCCGIDNYTDWTNVLNGSIPISCCSRRPGTLDNDTCRPNDSLYKLHAKGCLAGFADFISSHAASLGSAGIVLALIQGVETFFACYIAREIRIKNGGVGLF